MATHDEILARAEVAARYGISDNIVEAFIKSGVLKGWTSGGEGRGQRWHIPASEAERHLGVYRDSLDSKEAMARAGVEKSAVSSAVKRGLLIPLRAPANGHMKQELRFTAKAVDAWIDSRTRKERREQGHASVAVSSAVNGHNANGIQDVPLPLDARAATPAELFGNLEATEALTNAVDALSGQILALNNRLLSQQAQQGEEHRALVTVIDKLATWVEQLAK